ncbi:hypothetical protein ABK040_007113 [Willaertia magna]
MGQSPSASGRDENQNDIDSFWSNNGEEVIQKKKNFFSRFNSTSNSNSRNDQHSDSYWSANETEASTSSSLSKLRTRKNRASSTFNKVNYNIKDFKKFKHFDRITSLIVNENKIYTSSIDGTICCWNKNTGECLNVLQGHCHIVTCIYLHNNFLYSTSYDRSIKCWDLNTNECIYTLKDNDNWINTITVNDEYVCIAGYDCNITIYDNQTNKKIAKLHGHTKKIEYLYLDNDTLLYSLSSDNTIRCWDIHSLECIKTYTLLDSSYFIQKYDNLLFVSQLQQVVCLNKDFLPFVGISNFTIVDDFMIGWNKEKQQFEIYNILNRQLIYTKKENILNANHLHYDSQSNKLFYVSGVTVKYLSLNLSQFEKNQNVENLNVIYLKYKELFNYFEHVLFYPTNKIVNFIETLDNELARLTFDEQVKLIVDKYHINYKINFTITIDTPSNTLVEDLSNLPIIDNSQQPLINDNNIVTKSVDDTMEMKREDFEVKCSYFYKQLNQLKDNEVLQPTVLLVRREELVFDACKHFSILKGKDLMKPMYIFFAGEQALDIGGVTREFYHLLSNQILNVNNALFLNTGINNTYHINPSSMINNDHLQYFTFIGKLIGKAIFDMQIMDLHFTRVIFKCIIGKPIQFEDLEYVDPSMYYSLLKLLNIENVEQLMEMNFTVELNDFGFNNCVELLPNGNDILVNDENKYQYVELYAKWKLIESIKLQLEKLLEGIYEVIPKHLLSIFTENELELLLCGSNEINIKEWKEYTEYDSLLVDNSFIDMFFEMLEDFNQIQLSLLLQFVTGTSCLPNDGFSALNPPFTICALRNEDINFLPVAHTCFNRIDMPLYTSKEMMKERFLKAISYNGAQGFNIY